MVNQRWVNVDIVYQWYFFRNKGSCPQPHQNITILSLLLHTVKMGKDDFERMWNSESKNSPGTTNCHLVVLFDSIRNDKQIQISKSTITYTFIKWYTRSRKLTMGVHNISATNTWCHIIHIFFNLVGAY